MRKVAFYSAVALVTLTVTVSGLAQQNNQFKVKPSHSDKVKQSAPLPIGKATGPGASANAKDLQAVEHQAAAKPAAAPKAAAKTKAPAVTLEKDQPNPKINFNASGAPKNAGMINQGADPYKGRVRHGRE